MLRSSGKDLKLWYEICTHNLEDWKNFLSLCAQSFQNTEFSRRYLPDVEKRKLFLPHYFNYNYETMFSNGRAGLACLKTISEESGGKPEIVLGTMLVYDPLLLSDGDQSPMIEAYPNGTELVMRRDAWLQTAVHSIMADVAQKAGIAVAFGAYQAVSPKYKDMGLGSKYMHKAHRMLEEEACKVKQIKLPLLVYALILQSALLKGRFNKAVQGEELAHLHFNYRKGLSCFSSSTYKEGDECSCVHLVCSRLRSRHDEIFLEVKRYLDLSNGSKL